MSQNTKIVPSRDALRALRTLAFSPQAAFVGAAGSVCGLIAIHHHQRRKVKLAEKILETKRTIHSLSRGRGNAQANRMFEAAEKGEDFTLHHGRPRRSQRTRRYSADAVAIPVHEEPVFKPWIQLDDIKDSRQEEVPSRRLKAPNRMPQSGVRQVEFRTEKSTPAPIDDQLKQSRQLPRAPHVDREIEDTRALWKAKKYKQNVPGQWSETVAEAKERLKTRWRHSVKAELMPDAKSDRALHSSEQVSTDLNPVPEMPIVSFEDIVADMSSELSAEESVFFNFVFGKPSPDSIFETNVFRSLQPWEMEVSPDGDQHTEAVECVERVERVKYDTPVGLKITHDPVTTDSMATQPAGTTYPELKSLYDPEDRKVQQKLGRAGGISHYFDAFSEVARAFTAGGLAQALARFESSLLEHFSSQHGKNLTFVTMLVRDTSQFLTYESFGPAMRRVIRDQLSKDDPDLNIVRLLYQGLGHDRPTVLQPQYYFSAHQYIQEFCIVVPDHDEQVSELYKILEGSARIGIPPTERLIVSVLRTLSKAGRVKQAHELHDAVVSQYKISTTFYSLAEIMRGYASAGEWPKVKALMERAHSENLSWKKVYGYSAMFGGTIEQYASNYPPERVYKYVEHCIAEYGLVPTSVVSSRLIRVCLRARRYDLVREWILKIQREFSFLSTGINSHTFAAEVGLLWREMNATCKDILAGVGALSMNAIQDPFTKAFRGIASEAVQKDLFMRIKSLEKHTKYKLPQYRTIEDVQGLLEDVKELVTRIFESGFTSRTRLLADDLIQQTKAVVEIDQLFSGSYYAQKQGVWDQKYSTPQQKPAASTFTGMPHPLRVARLPSLKAVTTLLEKAYHSRAEHDQSSDQHRFHDVLRFTVERLEKQKRHSDAYALMDIIYNSKWTTSEIGVPFDTDMFTTWLQLAVALKSGTKYRTVLWNVVDAGPELRVTTELILMARIGAHKTHDSRFRQGLAESIAEAEYLRARLRRRKQLQGDTHVKFSSWRGLHDDSLQRFEEMEAEAEKDPAHDEVL